jgi:glycine/D-amino acid oxidase-like deaminating enzyme
MKAVADEAGLEVDFIDNATAHEKWPMMNFDRVKSVLWCPTDGYLQPSDLSMAYAAAARKAGITFRTNTIARGILTQAGRVTGVETDTDTIDCDIVINAAGAHAYHVAKSVGIELPIVPVRHEFFVTIHTDFLTPDLPVLRIPDATLYVRADTTALLCGGWEPQAVSTDPRSMAADRDAPAIAEDWDVLGQFAEQLAPHLPDVAELGIRHVFRGWPTFTPDGRFIIGECCRLQGFVMAGGCNAHGVSGSAGIGRHVVESMLTADPSPYVKSLSPDRFTEQTWDWDTACTAARACYETYYHINH